MPCAVRYTKDAKAPATSQASCRETDELVSLLIQNYALDALEQCVGLSDEQPETGSRVNTEVASDFPNLNLRGGRRAVLVLNGGVNKDAHGSLPD